MHTFKSLLFALCVLVSINIFSQTLGDFRSKTVGPLTWNSSASWETYDGSSWINATTYPGQNSGTNTVTIQTGHTISISEDLVTSSMNNIIVFGNLNLGSGSTVKKITLSTTLLYISGGILSFNTQKTELYLPANSVLKLDNGGDITGACSNNTEIYIGGELIAVCAGGGGSVLTFGDVIAGGGTLDAEITTPFSNLSSSCGGLTIDILGKYLGTATGAIYTWSVRDPDYLLVSISNSIGSLANNLSTTTPTFFTPTKSGDYIISLSVTDGSNFTNTETRKITVQSAVTTGTIGTTQTICKGSTPEALTSSLDGTGSGTISYEWQTNTGGSYVTIDGVTSAAYSPPSVTGTTGYRRRTVSTLNGASCYSNYTSPVIINVVNLWTGAVSSDWNTDNNWCSGVPSAINNLDVIIPSGLARYPILSIGLEGYVENILFENNTTLNVVNNSLRVTGNITLNGKMDLEGESQLLQDEGSVLDNTSTGYIEIDQQGESNKYRYNYWSSPVITTGSTNGSSFSIKNVLRDGTDSNNPKLPLWTTGYDGSETTPITISTHWMYKYANSPDGNYSAWYQIRESGAIFSGEGFSMKGTKVPGLPDQNYVFVGKPNNGTIELTVSGGYDYLIGNPYPSAIDANQFIIDNSPAGTGSITGSIYFWEHYGGDSHNLSDYQGGYATYSLAGAVPATAGSIPGLSSLGTPAKTPKRYIPVGQGFFVVGDSDGGQIQFNNSQRILEVEGVSSTFMKSSNIKSKTNKIDVTNRKPKFRIGFNAPKIDHRQLLLTIDENTSDAVDWGYDSEIYNVFSDDMYWVLEEKKYIIQATNTFSLDKEVPIGIETAEGGLISIKVDAIENVDEQISVYIKDKLTGETYEINNQAFEINLEAGEYKNRFVVTFQPRLKTLEEVALVEGVLVYMNNDISELQLNRIVDTEIVNVSLFNYLGQQVKTWDINTDERFISLQLQMATGVYITQVHTTAGVITKKIIIE